MSCSESCLVFVHVSHVYYYQLLVYVYLAFCHSLALAFPSYVSVYVYFRDEPSTPLVVLTFLLLSGLTQFQ